MPVNSKKGKFVCPGGWAVFSFCLMMGRIRMEIGKRHRKKTSWKGSGKNKKEAQQKLLRFFLGLLRGFVKMLKIRLAGQAVAGPPIIARLFAFLSF